MVENRVETTAGVGVVAEGRLPLQGQETFVDEVILRSFGYRDFAPESGRFLGVGSGLGWALVGPLGTAYDGKYPMVLWSGHLAPSGAAYLLQVLVGIVPSTIYDQYTHAHYFTQT